MQKLKLCPFCGGNDIRILTINHIDGKSLYSCFCWNCECKINFYKTKKTAINKWNSRVSEPKPKQDASAFMSAMEDMYNVTFVDAKKEK
jgi:Lar family restriction alleviation protein